MTLYKSSLCFVCTAKYEIVIILSDYKITLTPFTSNHIKFNFHSYNSYKYYKFHQHLWHNKYDTHLYVQRMVR